MEVPLSVSKKPLIEYYQKRTKAVMTRWKMVMMMEIVAARNHIDQSNSVISWMKNGVSNCHLRNKQISNVTNFMFLFHNFDHSPCYSWNQDYFLRIMSKTIANNAITPRTNHTLSPLRGGHRNLVP